ncbi:MAG TPA: double zinc ribbon domain-containing protein, partial [Kiloniellales bacterium]|nr:double zinc ribbon domain-containing protein [Kiloniellales bacterium]
MPTLQALGGSLRGLAGLALDALLPPRCLACGQTVEGAGALCAGCWEAIEFLAPPYCAVCGLPFEFDLGPEALCGACSREPPPFDRARAVMRYDQASKG